MQGHWSYYSGDDWEYWDCANSGAVIQKQRIDGHVIASIGRDVVYHGYSVEDAKNAVAIAIKMEEEN